MSVHKSYNIDTHKITWRRVDNDEVIVLNTDTEFYYIFNNTAADILDLIAANKDKKEIVVSLSEKYDQDESIIDADVTEFLEKAVNEQIIQAE